jgi:hypothetical protein
MYYLTKNIARNISPEIFCFLCEPRTISIENESFKKKFGFSVLTSGEY